MPLKIHLASNQRVLLNGAVVVPERQARLVILNQASVIRLPDQSVTDDQLAGEKLILTLFSFWLEAERDGTRLIEELHQQRQDAMRRGMPRAVAALDSVMQMITQGANRTVILNLVKKLLEEGD